MVLDESALEAMLARQRAAERGHEPAPSVRTLKTDEFEVYERQPEEAPAQPAEPARAPAAPRAPSAGDSPRPTAPGTAQPPARVPPADDFEELPGRNADFAGVAGPRPAAPDGHGSAFDPGTPAPTSPAPAPPTSPAPPEPEAPWQAPTAPSVHDAQAPRSRRPQVWPPIGERDAGPKASSPTERGPPTAPQPAPSNPSLPQQRASAAEHADPTGDPREAGGGPPSVDGPDRPRTHAPAPHAPAAPSALERAEGCRIAVVQALFNQEITDAMAQQALAHARSCGAETSLHQVPGVFDLPLTVQHLARRKDVDAIVVIGCVIRGETKHDELITFTTAKTLQEIALATDTPVALGITGPGMTWQQAQARIGNGAHAVDAAIAMWRIAQKA